ncbi:MAG: hypothetical protein H5T69_01610 [Chloroflexi bacterium]|nr:hypothetical protein [Chloroflexota bacterium]
MKRRGIVILSVGMLVAFLLVCASASRCIALPLPIAVLIALGLPDLLLLWSHRRKMSMYLNPPLR